MKTGIATSVFRHALVAMVSLSLIAPTTSPPPAFASNTTTLTFAGGGWGHGIGMSQYGARGYALQGWKYDRILAHYFQDTRLEAKNTTTVRVNLDKAKAARAAWRIQAGTDTTLTVTELANRANSISLREKTGDVPATYWITMQAGNTRLHRDASGAPGEIIATFTGRCFAKAGTSTVRILDKSGPFDHANVAWRGRLHFIPDTASTSACVNFVDMEDYLKGVVPRESPSSWPAEALKAQAVVARSYAYDDAVNKRTIWCTTMSQVYNGQSRPGYTHEPSTTNSAISATKGKVVWYGSEKKPVKTYFFSSSGGHTANIEHVWSSSSAKPYYKGVADADKGGNPYYTWNTGPLDSADAIVNGQTVQGVSSKVRSRVGASYSAPAPHTITGIELDRAASGHVRYATITWSDGVSRRIRGDTLRSALGMRSTNFSVTVKGPAVPVNTYQQTDSRIAWSGVWSTAKHANAYGGTYKRTKLKRSAAVVRFTGTGVTWRGTKAPSLGKVAVEIDGVRVGIVDQYASKTLTRQKLYSVSGLPAGEHTLVLTALSSRNKRSSGYGASLDRIDVTAGELLKAPAPIQAYEDTGKHVAELGGWTRATGGESSGGTHLVNARKGAQVIVDFYGTGITWVGAKGPGYGTARVSVDGTKPKSVSLASDQPLSAQQVFKISGLSSQRKHRLVIDVVGPSATGSGLVSVDRFDVRRGWVTTPVLDKKRIQQTKATTTGSWKTVRNSKASAGTHMVAGKKGSSATFVVEGNEIAWYGARARGYGKAEVLLDGKRVAVVDLYGSKTKLRQKLWSKTGLSAKKHTVTIRVLGKKRAASRGTLVSVDALDVKGRLAPKPW